ncbi:MAG: hypothetical protein JWR72_2497 [Flavisolibacter sp.]|jgi:hypothetical protein|nr:hypothetical protein [Flavisolibacter sp.]
MQARTSLLFILIFYSTVAIAQKRSFPLEGNIQAGLLEGEKGSAFQLSMMGGLRYKTWTTSVGTGLDYYGIRSIPLYLNVQKRLFNRTQTPFLYLGSGYHFPWVNTDYKDSWRETKTKGGLYYSGGIGYQLPAIKKAALFFAAGYSLKQYFEEVTSLSPCLIAPCPEYKEKFKYRLRRLSVTTGLRF